MLDLIVLLKELSSTGISDVVIIGVALLVVRYWLSETRREISKEIDDKIGSAKSDLEQSIQQETGALRTQFEQSHRENRQEIIAVRTYSEQSHKEIMLHLIDVRERLANIEGRLGEPTPRMSAVSPPLESPAEASES